MARKGFVAAASAGAILAFVGLGWLWPDGEDAAPRYRTVAASRGNIVMSVSATGSLSPVVTVDVGSPISGQVKEILADFNSLVRTGDVIAVIDPEVYETRVRQARAEVEMARASVLTQEAALLRASADLENARAVLNVARANTARAEESRADADRELNRRLPLARSGIVSGRDLDRARTELQQAEAALRGAQAQEHVHAASIASAEAQIKAAEAGHASAKAQVLQREAALAQAQAELERTRIRAPLDGVVVLRNVNLGQTVSASLQTPTLFTIARDLSQMQVELSVDEADVGRVREGQRVPFTVDAFPGTTFEGRVQQIRKAPRTIQNVVSYAVIVSADNPGQRLMPGMTANARIVVDERRDVLRLPNAAFRWRPPGGEFGTAGGGASPGPGGDELGAPGAGESPETAARRLAQALGLDSGQSAVVQAALQETRDRVQGLRRSGATEADIRNAQRDGRRRAQERIVAALTPDQQARYRQMTADRTPRGGVVRNERVFVLGGDGRLSPVPVRVGISDGSFAEMIEGEVADGQEVVIGTAPGAAAAQSASPWRIRL